MKYIKKLVLFSAIALVAMPLPSQGMQQIRSQLFGNPITQEQIQTARMCPICLGNFAQNDQVTLLNCGTQESPHLYHTECLRPWILAGRNTCPTCRATIPANTIPVPLSMQAHNFMNQYNPITRDNLERILVWSGIFAWIYAAGNAINSNPTPFNIRALSIVTAGGLATTSIGRNTGNHPNRSVRIAGLLGILSISMMSGLAAVYLLNNSNSNLRLNHPAGS